MCVCGGSVCVWWECGCGGSVGVCGCVCVYGVWYVCGVWCVCGVGVRVMGGCEFGGSESIVRSGIAYEVSEIVTVWGEVL